MELYPGTRYHFRDFGSRKGCFYRFSSGTSLYVQRPSTSPVDSAMVNLPNEPVPSMIAVTVAMALVLPFKL